MTSGTDQSGDRISGVTYADKPSPEVHMKEFDSFSKPVRQALANAAYDYAIMGMRQRLKGQTNRQIVNRIELQDKAIMAAAYDEKGCPHDL